MLKKSKIKYAYFIDGVSRKFTLVKNKCVNTMRGGMNNDIVFEPSRYMGGQIRSTVRNGVGAVQQNVLFLRFNPRTSSPTASEITARNTFAAAAALRKTWKSNLQTVAKINAIWKNDQMVGAGGVHKYG